MAKLFDRIGQATATTGTGSVTLGAVITDSTNGDLATFSDMGAVAGDVVNYLIVDGSNFEIGTGTLGGTGPGFTLSRTVAKSKISGTVGTTALTLSGAAKVYAAAVSSLANTWANGASFGGALSGTTANANLFGLSSLSFNSCLTIDGGIAAVLSGGNVRYLYNGSNVAKGYVIDARFPISWSSLTDQSDASTLQTFVDLQLFRGGAGTLAQANSTNAQTFKVYGSIDNATGIPTTNYSRLSIAHLGGTSGAVIATEAGGTGTAGDLTFAPGGSYGRILGVRNVMGYGAGDIVTSRLVAEYIGHGSAGSSGGGTSLNSVFRGTEITLSSNTKLAFSSTGFGSVTQAFDLYGNIDVAVGRNAAGVVEINNGTAGTYRDLKVRNIEITGTQTGGSAGGGGASLSTANVWTATQQFGNGSLYGGVQVGVGSSDSGFANYGGILFVRSGTPKIRMNDTEFNLWSGMRLAFAADDNVDNPGDVWVQRGGANTLALARSTNAQTLKVYGTIDNATGVPTTNYSRLSISHAGGTAGAVIATEAGGTGTAGDLTLRVAALFVRNVADTSYTGILCDYISLQGNQYINAGNYARLDGGAYNASGAVKFGSTGGVCWTPTDVNGTNDTGMGRNAAGVVEINNGTAGAYRDLKVRSVIEVPPASVTPANNGELVVQATSNTSLTFKYKGSDGTVRTASLTLA